MQACPVIGMDAVGPAATIIDRNMIDHRHRIIFIHQRKVAGSSIMTSLGHSPKRPEWHRFNDGVLSPDWAQRDTSYFVFSAVRNPFDRLISSWKYLKSTCDRTLLDVLRAPPLEGIDYRHLTRPQIAILRDLESGMLVTDDLIRFERLQQDFDRICDRIGRARRPLDHINASNRMAGYRYHFDAETRHLAERMFAEDLSVFGYEF
jgi:chondroitin 4-sulfotransferase 11